jgi:hypothetical protein
MLALCGVYQKKEQIFLIAKFWGKVVNTEI